ncbi:hypothetical protein [Thermodesulforhabdus norvegica]|uniref:AsmA-like C-terminal domain-containing protein n=1 Tax=Thermodesulforhabdus norvegica TaxID=39841 RepID=A0A1I4U6V0_9BACT|nr:hypothetical protein [Thermodesulforhabdus norvegica]SFM84698.1 hypothetical protein SAMN05660836_01673 [Thermodesulforhabdus norvegica]
MFKKIVIYLIKCISSFLILLSLHPPANAADDFSINTCGEPPTRAFTISDVGLSFPFVRIAHVKARISVSPSRNCTWLITIEKGRMGLLRLYLPNGKGLLIENTEIEGTIAYRKGIVVSSHITVKLGKPLGGTIMLIQKHENQRDKNTVDLAIYNSNLFEVVNTLMNDSLAAGSFPFELEIRATFGRQIEVATVQGILRNVSFEDHNFENAAEDLKVDLSATARFSGSGWRVKGKAECSKGNLFSKGYVIDFATLPLTVNFEFLHDGEIPPDGTADIFLDNVASVRLVSKTSELQWEINVPDLEVLVGRLLSVAEGVIPALRELEAGGSFKAQGLYRYASGSGCLKGSMQCLNCSLLYKKVRSRFDVDLPVYLSNLPEGSTCKDETISGKIVLEETTIGDLSLTDYYVPITASLNTWKLVDPIEFNLSWGKVVVRRGIFEIFPKPRGLIKVDIPDSLRFEFSHKDLARPLKLEIERASNIDVLYQNNKLEISPAVKLRVFSGQLTVDHFSIEDPLSPSRSLVLDAHWKGIDLEELSRLVSFGIIKGKLFGEVKDLRIVYGLPVSFDLRLMSEPAEEQTISVLAVRNITQIGSSGNPFQGVTGAVMTTFFKEFPYDRIGIRCTLKNDQFSVRGLIKEGDTEYLIRKRGIRGINVINRQSPNVISWNEMIRRLKRIERAESAKTEDKER